MIFLLHLKQLKANQTLIYPHTLIKEQNADQNQH
jgi:hypothetical protein